MGVAGDGRFINCSPDAILQLLDPEIQVGLILAVEENCGAEAFVTVDIHSGDAILSAVYWGQRQYSVTRIFMSVRDYRLNIRY